MTRQKSFKRIVRARMEKTGESYTAVRRSLLAGAGPRAAAGPTLTVSDEVIRRRTGRGWEEWFDLLDRWGAVERPHREIARWLRSAHAIDGWSAQSVTVSYERARNLRAVGERPTASPLPRRIAPVSETRRGVTGAAHVEVCGLPAQPTRSATCLAGTVRSQRRIRVRAE